LNQHSDTSNGGDSFFIEQTATQLEVDESQVTVTSVKEGSVIITFKIASGGSKAADIQAIKAKLDAAVSSGAMTVYPGAVILDYESGFVTVGKFFFILSIVSYLKSCNWIIIVR